MQVQLEPARTESIVADRTLWGGKIWLPLVRQLEGGGEQRGKLCRAHQLERQFFFVFQIRGSYDEPSVVYESLKEFLAAGWRAA